MTPPEQGGVFTPETLDRYLQSGHPSVHRIGEQPECTLLIEPHLRTLRLRTPATDSLPELGGYDRIKFDIIEEPGEAGIWFDLAIDADGVAFEGYSLIMAVADHLQAGQQFKQAVSDALATFRELLARRRGLSDEQEVGLFGELAVFEHLIDSIGEEAATASWLGPDSEEHDFVIPECDLEVKTTRAEGRVHVIGAASQLTTSPDRPLYLVSIQITGGGAATGGETLPQRVQRIRTLLGKSGRVFDERLRSLGWDAASAPETYTRRFLPRSAPRTYQIDERFPAINHEGIARIVARPELVVSLAYRIDVTGLTASEPPAALTGFCERNTHDRA